MSWLFIDYGPGCGWSFSDIFCPLFGCGGRWAPCGGPEGGQNY